MRCRLGTLAVLVLFLMPAALAADDEDIRKAVLEVHARMMQAAQALDADKMFAFIREAGPGTIIDDGVVRKSRQEALDTVKRGFQAVTRAERKYSRTDVTVLAPTVALLTGEGVASFVLADGRTVSAPFAVSEVFVFSGGEWKVVHGHHSVPNQ
jgi:hypothetical protein